MTKASRRKLFKFGAAAGGAMVAAGARAATAPAGVPVAPALSDPWGHSLGAGVDAVPYGQPSPYEKDAIRRYVPWLAQSPQADASFTPLQDQPGIITANGFFFERYHAGRVTVDPAAWRLMIMGLVDKPLLLTLDDLKRFPSISRTYFLECPANGATEWPAAQLNSLQFTHGLIGCAEWTGVKLSTLLNEVGLQPAGKWMLAEGGDGSHLTRSVPIEKAMDDCLIAWGQNGEALRPEQGYPARLIVPGWQGNQMVKWLRRLEIGTSPWYTHEETASYTELMPNGKALAFTWVAEAKSVISFPCPEKPLTGGPGFYEVRGFAWSGRGKIKAVDVSFDGGVNYKRATLQEPVLDKCMTRFTIPWRWDGKPALIQSRAVDETGYVQPTIAEARAIMGTAPVYLNNSIQTWEVLGDGRVNNVQLS